MPDTTSPQDSYGQTNPPAPDEPVNAAGLPIEETPEIPMPQPTEVPKAATAPPPPAPTPKSSFGTTVGLIILFLGLFALGIWGSGFIRQFFPGDLVGVTPSQQQVAAEPTATPMPVDPLAS